MFQVDNRRVLVIAGSRLAAEALLFALDSDPAIDAIGYGVDLGEGVELVAAYEPDVLIVGSGALDQLELIRFVDEFFPEVIQIAICSGSAELLAARDAGAAICLRDSCSADELLHAITSRRSRSTAASMGCDSHLRLVGAVSGRA